MRMLLFLTMALLAVPLSASGQTETQPPPPDTDPLPNPKTAFIRVRHAQASHIAIMLRQVAANVARGRSQPPGVTSDPDTQNLIVTGTDEDLKLARMVVAELDVPRQDPQLQEDRRRTSFQYVLYEVSLPRDRAAMIRVDELIGKAETAMSLKAALQEIGDAQVLYRADRVLHFRWASKTKTVFTMGSNTPFVRNTTSTDRGTVNSQVEYEDVGCIVKLAGGWDAPSRGSARIDMELSSLTDSTVNLGNDINAPIFHKVVQHFDGPIASGEPIVLLTIDGSGEKETATAYVTRLQFDRTEAN